MSMTTFTAWGKWKCSNVWGGRTLCSSSHSRIPGHSCQSSLKAAVRHWFAVTGWGALEWSELRHRSFSFPTVGTANSEGFVASGEIRIIMVWLSLPSSYGIFEQEFACLVTIYSLIVLPDSVPTMTSLIGIRKKNVQFPTLSVNLQLTVNILE